VYEASVTKEWIFQEEEVSDICNEIGIPVIEMTLPTKQGRKREL
jgi:hypothetical protein